MAVTREELYFTLHSPGFFPVLVPTPPNEPARYSVKCISHAGDYRFCVDFPPHEELHFSPLGKYRFIPSDQHFGWIAHSNYKHEMEMLPLLPGQVLSIGLQVHFYHEIPILPFLENAFESNVIAFYANWEDGLVVYPEDAEEDYLAIIKECTKYSSEEYPKGCREMAQKLHRRAITSQRCIQKCQPLPHGGDFFQILKEMETAGFFRYLPSSSKK